MLSGSEQGETMRARSVTATLLVLALLAAETRAAQATPIVYSLEFVASGRLGSRPFRNQPVVLTVFTDTEPVSIDDIPTYVENADERLVQALAAVSAIAGLGFVLAAFFKFHQHKQNPPQQVTIQLGGTPGVADGTVVATLSGRALGDYTLGDPTGRLVTEVILAGPLELPVLRNSKVRTLRIDSIRRDRAELRAQLVAETP
jgi:hypothetical protein